MHYKATQSPTHGPNIACKPSYLAPRSPNGVGNLVPGKQWSLTWSPSPYQIPKPQVLHCWLLLGHASFPTSGSGLDHALSPPHPNQFRGGPLPFHPTPLMGPSHTSFPFRARLWLHCPPPPTPLRVAGWCPLHPPTLVPDQDHWRDPACRWTGRCPSD